MADDAKLAQATAPMSFAEFLERMKDPAAADLVRSIKSFISSFDGRKGDPGQDASQVQQFLAKSEGAFRQHPVWASGPQEHQSQAIEGLEKYLMTKIYAKTFGTSELDRERDTTLQMRMKALKFVEPEHLDLPAAYKDLEAITRAQEQLTKINNYKAPRDKLVCILNCSRIINGILSAGAINKKSHGAGADDFLPLMIYVAIHANPPQLASNLEYIQRYRMKSRMVSESSYFYTQLYSAASFIETINVNSLTMDPDEFRARMMDANVPDMAIFFEPSNLPAPKSEEPEDESPFRASSLMLPPEAPAKPALTRPEPKQAQKQGTSPKVALAKQDRSLSADTSGHNSASKTSDSMRSLAEMEEAGYAHLLKDEASGALQKRHPYIYASAPELRIADVAHLLAAYKRVVLRYESLSLLLAHKQAALSDGSGDADDVAWSRIFNYTAPLSSGPPVVDGPNPFAAATLGGPEQAAPSRRKEPAEGFGRRDVFESLATSAARPIDGKPAIKPSLNESSFTPARKEGSGAASLESLIHARKSHLALPHMRVSGLPFRTAKSQSDGPRPQLTTASLSGALQEPETPDATVMVKSAPQPPTGEALPASSLEGDTGQSSATSEQDLTGVGTEKGVAFKACPVPDMFSEKRSTSAGLAGEGLNSSQTQSSSPEKLPDGGHLPSGPLASDDSDDNRKSSDDLPDGHLPDGLPDGHTPDGLPDGHTPDGLPDGHTPDGLPDGHTPDGYSPDNVPATSAAVSSANVQGPPSRSGSEADSTEGFAFSPFAAESKADSFEKPVPGPKAEATGAGSAKLTLRDKAASQAPTKTIHSPYNEESLI